MVREVVPGSRVTYATDGGPDLRCYRVDCGKIERMLKDFRPRWTVRQGIEELYAAYQRRNLSLDDLAGARYVRLARIQELRTAGTIDASLRTRPAQPAEGVPASASSRAT